MTPRYIIVDLCEEGDEEIFRDLIKNKIISIYKIVPYVIIARYGVNKRTLRKILRKEIT